MRIKQVFLMIFLLMAFSTEAAYLHARKASKIYGAGVIQFAVDNPPSDTCKYYERHFKFDATTVQGKNMLSILLAAKMADKAVNVWYTPSSNPGTNNTNGCVTQNMATVYGVGID